MRARSTRRQVPGVVERRYVRVELLHLTASRGRIQIRERISQIAAHELTALERGQGFRPGERNGCAPVAVSVARERGTRIELLREPVMHARQHYACEQVRIGIRSRDPVLDATACRWTVRDTKGDAAVVDGPARRERHVGFRPK